MLEMLLDKKLLYVVMGVLTGVGVADKCIVSMTMKRLVEAAGSMSKSNHPLMRLVRAKFEHACMISDTVENVGVFVDKYLFEYRVCGLRLHTLRRMEKICAGLLVVTGLVGAGITYQVYGMEDAVLRIGACGVGLGILVWLFHLTTDENYCMQMAKNYMVDYLENVCLRKYEKVNLKERMEREKIYRDEIENKSAKAEAEYMEKQEKKAEAEYIERKKEESVKEQGKESEKEPAGADNVISDHSVVQMQRETRRKERAKGTARNLARASARLAGADGSRNVEEDTEETNAAKTNVAKADTMEGIFKKESVYEDTREDTGENLPEDLPKDEMIRQILREFMA